MQKILWLFALGWGWLGLQHAIYIGVVEIQHQAERSELVIKVFSDDLSDAIFHFSAYRPTMDSELDSIGLAHIEAYFQTHLQIQTDGEIIPFAIKKFSIEQDTHWLYFSLQLPPKIHQIEIHADFFMELFPSQMNVIKFHSAQIQQYGRLSSQQKQLQFHFE